MTMLFGLVIAVGLMSGCAGYMEYMQRSMAPNINSATVTEYGSEEYTVLGPVEAVGESKCILGVYITGEDGQGLLMRAAKQAFPNATGVKDVSAVKNYEGVLPPVYATITTTYYGVAVQE